MEAGHGKGQCDPIGGTAKGKAEQTVKNNKAVIQNARLFSIDDYETSLSFLSEACNGIKFVDGTMKLHAVFSSTGWGALLVFCQNCFGSPFKPETACDGWRIVDLQWKRNPSILSSSEKAVEIPEN